MRASGTGSAAGLDLERRRVSITSIAGKAGKKEGSPGLHLGWVFILPGYGEPQERVEIIGCLENETVARIFVADTAEGVATLSLETSTCARATYNEIDPRSMMLAKVEGFPEDT